MTDYSPQPTLHPRLLHPPFARIACVIDADAESLHAVEQTLAIADTDAHVTFAAFRPGLAERVEEALSRAREAGLDPERQKPDAASPEEGLARLTATHDLVVIGAPTHARATGIVLGDAATRLVHRSPIPVLIARERPLVDGVVAATRAHPADRAALIAGARIAARLGAELTVVHVEERDDQTREPELQAELANTRALLGRPLNVLRPKGPVARGIVDVADGDGAGLVVLGSRLRVGLPALTSVSERVAHHAPCSVLIMRGR